MGCEEVKIECVGEGVQIWIIYIHHDYEILRAGKGGGEHSGGILVLGFLFFSFLIYLLDSSWGTHTYI